MPFRIVPGVYWCISLRLEIILRPDLSVKEINRTDLEIIFLFLSPSEVQFILKPPNVLQDLIKSIPTEKPLNLFI